MAKPALRSAPVRLLVLLALLELSLGGSFAPGSSLRSPPENHIDAPGASLWTPQASHHRRRALGKKERGAGLPRAVATPTRPASRLPEQKPAGLQDEDLLLGLALPYPEKQYRSPGWERARRRGREHKRRRDRAKPYRGSEGGGGAREDPRAGGEAQGDLGSLGRCQRHEHPRGGRGSH